MLSHFEFLFWGMEAAAPPMDGAHSSDEDTADLSRAILGSPTPEAAAGLSACPEAAAGEAAAGSSACPSAAAGPSAAPAPRPRWGKDVLDPKPKRRSSKTPATRPKRASVPKEAAAATQRPAAAASSSGTPLTRAAPMKRTPKSGKPLTKTVSHKLSCSTAEADCWQ